MDQIITPDGLALLCETYSFFHYIFSQKRIRMNFERAIYLKRIEFIVLRIIEQFQRKVLESYLK